MKRRRLAAVITYISEPPLCRKQYPKVPKLTAESSLANVVPLGVVSRSRLTWLISGADIVVIRRSTLEAKSRKTPSL